MPKYQHAKPFDIVRTIKDTQSAVKQLQISSPGTSPMPNPLVTLASGFTGYGPLTKMDVQVWNNFNSGTLPISNTWDIPAGDASVGTEYAIEVPFGGVFQNQTLIFSGSVDGGAGIAPNGIGAGFFSAGLGFNGTIRVRLVVRTAGVSGQSVIVTDGGIGVAANRSAGTNNNNAVVGATSSPFTFDTTIDHNLCVLAAWGGSTTSQTITSAWNKFIRSGP